MAYIECTIKEYHDIIGPRIRNKINSLTRNFRLARQGICEHCEEKGELDSAHIHGKGRRQIIESVLNNYADSNIIKGDLLTIESEILKQHLPIRNIFKFLCKKCHRAYDSVIPHSKTNTSVTKITTMINDQDFTKIYKIKGWADKNHQINNKLIRAFLEISEKGKVTLEHFESLCTSDKYGITKKSFNVNFASMKLDNGNSHGKIFYENSGYVEIYPEVMAEIKKYFNRF